MKKLLAVLLALMVVGGTSTYGLGFDFLVLTLANIVLIAIGSKMYPTIVH